MPQTKLDSLTTSHRWAAGLGLVLVVVMAVAAIDPVDRTVWWTETVLPVFVLAWLAATARSFALSPLSYGLIFCFMCLHTLGAHYTYPNVPVGAAWRALVGGDALALLDAGGRNDFDRVAHFAYGLALAIPLREVMLRLARVVGFWSHALAFSLLLTTGLLYEFIEWGLAARLDAAAAAAFLGTQGDPWDAHHDMLMCALGGGLSLLLKLAFDATRRGAPARTGCGDIAQ